MKWRATHVHGFTNQSDLIRQKLPRDFEDSGVLWLKMWEITSSSLIAPLIHRSLEYHMVF